MLNAWCELATDAGQRPWSVPEEIVNSGGSESTRQRVAVRTEAVLGCAILRIERRARDTTRHA